MIVTFLLLFATVYWSWVAYKETDKDEQKFAMLMAMLCAIAARVG